MPSPAFSLCDDGDDRGMVGLGCPWRWARQSGQVLESESVGATCSYPVVFLWLRLRCISYPRRQAAGAVHAIDSDSVKEHGISFFFGPFRFFSVPSSSEQSSQKVYTSLLHALQ
jgi:hypothetical protein